MAQPWSDLIAQHTSHIRACARKFLHDTEEAKDLSQDILLKALQSEDKFIAGSNLKGWLFTLTRNLFITNYQKSKKYQRLDLSDELYSGFDNLGFHINEGPGTLNIELINKAVEYLKEPYRKIIQMRMEGIKYEEIAEVLDLPCGTVKNRIFIARARMNEFLTSKQNNPFTMEAVATNNSALISHNPVSNKTTNVADKRGPYQRILDRLFLLIPTTEFAQVDRAKASKQCDVPTWMMDQSISALIRKGALIDQRSGIRKVYKRLPVYSFYTDTELERDVKAHIAPKEKPEQKPVDLPRNEALELVFATEKESSPKPTMLEVATESFQSAMASYQFGFLCPSNGLQWFTSKEEAAEKAKESSIANKVDRLHLMQKIGVIVNEPTVTFF